MKNVKYHSLADDYSNSSTDEVVVIQSNYYLSKAPEFYAFPKYFDYYKGDSDVAIFRVKRKEAV